MVAPFGSVLAVVLTMTLSVMGFYLVYHLVNALQRRLAGNDTVSGRLDDITDRLQELEALVGSAPDHELPQRMAEIEERLEFAERLLLREDNRARLPEATAEISAERTAP